MIQRIFDFFSSLKFRYSIVILLLGAVLFLTIYPTLFKKMEKDYFALIDKVAFAMVGFLGQAIGFFFQRKKEEEEFSIHHPSPVIDTQKKCNCNDGHTS